MLYTIKNERMTIAADTAGAELHSLKLDGMEYLWQGGEAWNRHAPILFPFICSPKDGLYRAKGKSYKMKANHGFARDMEFLASAPTKVSLSFRLEETPETLAQYPYPFCLLVRYTLLPDGVEVENVVENTGEGDMYFYLGGHPAFRVPLVPGETLEDYYVEYACPETIVHAGETLLSGEKVLRVTRGLFDHDAVILDNPKSKAISLRSDRSAHSVTVEYPESHCIAVWSPEKNDDAAFVCLEPWTSVPVYEDAAQDIEEKAHAICLAPGGTFSYHYRIRLT